MSVSHLVHLEVVIIKLDRVFQTVPERGVAASVDELMVVHEQSLGARDAIIAADIVRPPVLTCEGSFHTVLKLSQVELMRCEFCLHFLGVLVLIFTPPCLKVRL